MCVVGSDIYRTQLLETLEQLPFLSTEQVATLSGLELRKTRIALSAALNDGLAGFVRHKPTELANLRRWYLTGDGVRALTESKRATPERVMRLMPVSTEWQRSLLRRLDALHLFYRLLLQVHDLTGEIPDWTWYREGHHDAAIRLPDGRSFLLMRLGSTLSWQAIKSRVGSLYESQRGRRSPPALAIVAGEIGTHRIATLMRRRALNIHMVTEAAFGGQDATAPIWRTFGLNAGTKSLAEVLSGSHHRRRPTRPGHIRDGLPAPDIHQSVTDVNFAASELRPAERNLLRLLYDWPLLTSGQSADMLDVSRKNAERTRATLAEKGLIHKVEVGSSYRERRENGTRLVLSEAGRRVLAWTDRRDLSDLSRHWQLTPSEDEDPNPKMKVKTRNFRVDGTKIRSLIRELHHTDAVSEITAMMIVDGRTHSNYEVVEALPPHRWTRVFHFNGKRAQISPDAIYLMHHRGKPEVYFLEFEDRADAPSRMRPKVEAYRKYYGATETRQDFIGMRPATLFVFRDIETATRFRLFVRDQPMRQRPIFTSSLDEIRREGFFGNSWTWPWGLERGAMPLSTLSRSR